MPFGSLTTDGGVSHTERRTMVIDYRHPREIRAEIRAGRMSGVTAGLGSGQQFPIKEKKAEVGPRRDDGKRQEQAARGIGVGNEREWGAGGKRPPVFGPAADKPRRRQFDGTVRGRRKTERGVCPAHCPTDSRPHRPDTVLTSGPNSPRARYSRACATRSIIPAAIPACGSVGRADRPAPGPHG